MTSSSVKFELNFNQSLYLQTEKYGGEESSEHLFSFLVQTMENAVKTWHESSKVEPRVYFLLDNEKTDTEKYAPAVNIDKVGMFTITLFLCD